MYFYINLAFGGCKWFYSNLFKINWVVPVLFGDPTFCHLSDTGIKPWPFCINLIAQGFYERILYIYKVVTHCV